MPQMQRTNTQRGRVAPIVVAVDDPSLHPEALHVAAACGRPVVSAADSTELERARPGAFALLVDAPFATTPSPNTFLLAADTGPGTGPGIGPGIGAGSGPGGPEPYVLPAQSADLLRALGALGRQPAGAQTDAGRVVALVGAAGGVGVSTLGASISKRAGGHEPTLVDAHRCSGGLDLLLGIENEPGARWGEIELGEGVVARADVRRALPATADGIAVLTHPRTTVADPYRVGARDVEAVVGTVAVAGLTVLDAPAELVPRRCDLACVVLTPQLRPAAAAARIVAELAAVGVPHALVVRDSGWEALETGELERITGSRVLTRVGTARGLTRSVERGGLPRHLPRQLARPSDAILAEVMG